MYDGQPQTGPSFPPSQPGPPPLGAPPVGAPAMPGSPAPEAPKKKGASGLWGIIAVALVVAALYGIQWFNNRDKIDNAAVGDCATFAEGEDEPFTKADCGDATAKYVVLQIVSGYDDCKDVAGAERSIAKDGGDYICFGLKGVDPATAVNVAKVGDCLELHGDDATRVPCSSSDATHEVLKRLTNVPKFNLSLDGSRGPCADVDGATAWYAWSWSNEGPIRVPSLNHDVVLCLGDR